MYAVQIKTTHPGVRSSVFVFYNENEAYEFASCFHSKYPDAETVLSEVGEATEVFEHWSF
jgi:hypothetical protein